MRHVWNGLKLIFKSPALWPAAMAPMAVACLAYILILLLGFWALVPRMAEFATQFGLPEAIGWFTGSTLFAIVWIFISGPLFLVAFCTVSIFAWDKLSKAVELNINGTAPAERLTLGSLAADIFIRVTVATTIGLTIALLGWLGFGLVGGLLAGWMMLYDLTAATYARRGLSVLGQTTVVHRCKGWIGFWLTGAFVSVVPGLNVLFLPVFVTGATLMVIESERKTSPSPAHPVE